MLTRAIENGLKLHAEAFANGILHLQAEGLDGLQHSLLNRYGFINQLEPDSGAVAENDTLTTSGGVTLNISQDGSFKLSKNGVLLAESLASGCAASAPTVFRNQGFRLEMKLREKEKLIGFGDQVRTRLLLNGQHALSEISGQTRSRSFLYEQQRLRHLFQHNPQTCFRRGALLPGYGPLRCGKGIPGPLSLHRQQL